MSEPKEAPRIEIPALEQMVGRVILAAIAIGATVALAMGLRESGTALAFLMTASSVATSIFLSGALDRVRPVSRPTTSFAIVVEGLRKHWLAKFLTNDKTAQWLFAITVGLIVAVLDSWLQKMFWPGQAVLVWQQLLTLALLLFPGYLVLSLIFPRDRAAWVVQVEDGLREMFKISKRETEPNYILRAIGRAFARTGATVVVRALATIVVTFLTSSWLLMLAAGLIVLFLVAGGEVIVQVRAMLGSARKVVQASDSPAETDQTNSGEEVDTTDKPKP